MEISLHGAVRKLFLLLGALLVTAAYTALTGREFLAAHFAARADLASLRRAAGLEPGNANYPYLMGRYFWMVERSPQAAADAFRAAVRLNPHQARYWFDLAAVYQFLGDSNRQTDAMERAVVADPTTPEVAWEAASLYTVQGETEKALKEFRVVLENDPYLPPAVLPICWRLQPDVDVLIRDVIPPIASVNSLFLEILVAKKETAAAAKVWANLVKLRQPVRTGSAFGYMRYLILNQQPDQALLVWRQAGPLCNLSGYGPTSQNLVVNGDFGLPVLNGGLDWLYQQIPDVALALDPTQFHSGNRSLSIIFNSRGIEDAGIRQLIPVQPNTRYEFSAFFKAESIEGAGGPHFVLQDLYTSTTYLTSEALRDADFWKRVSGDFVTGPDSKMLVLRIQRLPAGAAIKGRLWIDSVRLAPKSAQG